MSVHPMSPLASAANRFRHLEVTRRTPSADDLRLGIKRGGAALLKVLFPAPSTDPPKSPKRQEEPTMSQSLKLSFEEIEQYAAPSNKCGSGESCSTSSFNFPISSKCQEAPENMAPMSPSLKLSFEEMENIAASSNKCRSGESGPAPSTDETISLECQEALKRMVTTGKALKMRFVEELETRKVLAERAEKCRNDIDIGMMTKLAVLREAVSCCAVATIATEPNTALLALWSVVHTSVSAAITDEAAAEASRKGKKALFNVIKDNNHKMASIGRLLQAALASSTELIGAVGPEVYAEAKKLLRERVPLPDKLLWEKLEPHLELIRGQLSEEEWQEFKRMCPKELKEKVDKLPEAVITTTPIAGVYDSPFAAAIAATTLPLATETMALGRNVVDAALDAYRDGRVIELKGFVGWVERMGLPPLLRLEIARDFFQVAGLFLAGLLIPVMAYLSNTDVGSDIRRIIWGLSRSYDVFAADVSAFLQSPTPASNVFVLFLVIGILAVWVSYLWFLKVGRLMHSPSHEIRHGHEATTWSKLAVRQATRIKLFTYIITACLTVYLPLTRLCLEVLVASIAPTVADLDGVTGIVIARMKNSAGWWFAVLMAIVILLTFSLTLPCVFYKQIKENQPKGSRENKKKTHDLEGNQIEFDDLEYARIVAKDPRQLRCPYRSLYAGFGPRWSHYKVWQLAVKMVLAFLIGCTVHASPGLRGWLTCGVYFLVVIFTFKGQPFTDPLNNHQERWSKLSALITCVCAALTIGPYTARLCGIVASATQALNLIVMVSVILLGMKRTRLWIKDKIGYMSFSDTYRGFEDAPAKDILEKWDLDKEVKHRVWQAFWRATLYQISEKKLGDDYSGVTIANRLADLEQAVVDHGARRVKSHWKGEENPYTVRLRQAVLDVLEGVDVYWEDVNACSKDHSSFGKMYVNPYPYHCVVVYDSKPDDDASQGYTIIRDDYEEGDNASTHRNLAKLFFLNFSPRIIAKREVRQKLRALSVLATSIRFPFAHEEEVELEDGITEVTRFGKKFTETRKTKVKFTCHYTWGVIRVETEGDGLGKTPRIMADGFNVTMRYHDGQGEAVAPNTGIVHTIKHRCITMGPDHIGLTHDMEESENLKKIFAETKYDWAEGMKKLRAQDQQYRRRLETKYRRENDTLSDGFWYEVYNKADLSRSKLEDHLKNREMNPRLQSLPKTHADALDALYLRLRYINSHPAIKFWYVFWDDVYACNGEMKRLRDHKAILDPMEKTSLCYRVMTKEKLEELLTKNELLGEKGHFVPELIQRHVKAIKNPVKFHLRRDLFEPKLLKRLYHRLDDLIKEANKGKTVSKLENEEAGQDKTPPKADNQEQDNIRSQGEATRENKLQNADKQHSKVLPFDDDILDESRPAANAAIGVPGPVAGGNHSSPIPSGGKVQKGASHKCVTHRN